MDPRVWMCDTNSGHEHQSAWEAENCSHLYALLREAVQAVTEGVADEALFEDVHALGVR